MLFLVMVDQQRPVAGPSGAQARPNSLPANLSLRLMSMEGRMPRSTGMCESGELPRKTSRWPAIVAISPTSLFIKHSVLKYFLACCVQVSFIAIAVILSPGWQEGRSQAKGLGQ